MNFACSVQNMQIPISFDFEKFAAHTKIGSNHMYAYRNGMKAPKKTHKTPIAQLYPHKLYTVQQFSSINTVHKYNSRPSQSQHMFRHENHSRSMRRLAPRYTPPMLKIANINSRSRECQQLHSAYGIKNGTAMATTTTTTTEGWNERMHSQVKTTN